MFIDGVAVSRLKKTFKTIAEVGALTADFLSTAGDVSLKRVHIEEALVGKGGVKTTIRQAYAMGAVRLCAEERGWRVGLVSVGTWKKQIVGNGNASKEEVPR